MQILFPEIDDQAYARSILTALKHLFKEDLIVQVTGHQEHNLHNCFNPTPSKIKEFYSTLKVFKMHYRKQMLLTICLLTNINSIKQ